MESRNRGTAAMGRKNNNYNKYKEFSSLVNKENQKPAFLRGFLDYTKKSHSI
jgi:hypothetical protein